MEFLIWSFFTGFEGMAGSGKISRLEMAMFVTNKGAGSSSVSPRPSSRATWCHYQMTRVVKVRVAESWASKGLRTPFGMLT